MDRAHTNQTQEISVQYEEVTTNKLVDGEGNMSETRRESSEPRGGSWLVVAGLVDSNRRHRCYVRLPESRPVASFVDVRDDGVL